MSDKGERSERKRHTVAQLADLAVLALQVLAHLGDRLAVQHRLERLLHDRRGRVLGGTNVVALPFGGRVSQV